MKCLLLPLLLLSSTWCLSQNPQRWFVDGMHGGVYGHYPIQTFTRFLNDQLEANSQWRLGMEIEPETWDTVQAYTPEEYQRMRRLMAGPQIEYTNPSYAQSYLYCILGESIIRQFQYGIRHLRKHFPTVRMLTYATEEPCYTSCLPTLLPQLGFRYLVLKCPDTCWGGYAAPFGGQFVSLQGPAGNSMLCVPRYACEGLQPKTTWQTLAWTNQAPYWDACTKAGILQPVGMCYQDAGWTGGPWIGKGDTLKFGTRYTLWTDYFRRYEADSEAPRHCFSQEEVCPGLMWGSQILQTLAQQVRHSENLLLQTEKVESIRQLLGMPYSPSSHLDEAWRQVMLAQHHDCWIVPYNRLNTKGNWAQNVALWTQYSDSTSHAIQGPQGNVFFNTIARPRHEVVKTPRGVFAVSAPAFGYTRQFSKATSRKSIHITRKKCDIETKEYHLSLDLEHGGVFSSLLSRKDNTEYAVDNDTLRLGEIRGFLRQQGGFRSSAEQGVKAVVLEDNSLLKQVQISGTIAGVPFTQLITLREGDPLIDIELTLDWQGGEQVGDTCFYDTRYMLSYLLPTPSSETSLVKSAPFDVCTSAQQHSYYRRWDDIHHNLILDWLDVESASGRGSLALFSDHTTSYTWGKGEALALTLQYSGAGLWGRDYSIQHPTHLHFALLPHSGDWKESDIPYHNQRWNQPLLPLLADGGADEQSLLDLSGTGYQLTACCTDQGTLLLRFYNATGNDSPQSIHLPYAIENVWSTDLLDNEQEQIPITTDDGGSQFTVSIPQHGVQTYRVMLK